jgi:hypothetical protein
MEISNLDQIIFNEEQHYSFDFQNMFYDEYEMWNNHEFEIESESEPIIQ